MSESSKLSRATFGIPGLDSLIEGGIPQDFNVMIAGSPGAGKSILAQNFIYTGAKNGEPGVYISLDESKQSIFNQASQFGWDFEKLEKDKLIIVEHMKLSSIDETFQSIKSFASKIKAKRIVIDSISTLFELTSMYQEIYHSIYENKPTDQFVSSQSKTGSIKKGIYTIFEKLRTLDCTILSISEASIGSDKISRDGISEFVCDGIICLNSVSMGQSVTRTLEVKKMRQTNIDGGVHVFEFSKSGIHITE